MAIGWLSVLKLVPWGDVIENAPKVAQGAKKLWNSVGRKPTSGVAATASAAPLAAGTPTLATLQAQVAELQVASAELQLHLQQSSALIQSLAEQNTALVARVELNRRHVVGLALIVLVLAVVLGFKLF